MKTTGELLKEKPARRTDMVLNGYKDITTRFSTTARGINILNNWLKLMAELIPNDRAPLPDEEDWDDMVDEYMQAGEDLSEAMVENAKALELFSKAVLIKRKNTPDGRTI